MKTILEIKVSNLANPKTFTGELWKKFEVQVPDNEDVSKLLYFLTETPHRIDFEVRKLLRYFTKAIPGWEIKESDNS